MAEGIKPDSGDFDMVGDFVSKTFHKRYHFRLLVKQGQKGDDLWRGNAEDMPFWGYCSRHPLKETYVDNEAVKPAPERGSEVFHGKSSHVWKKRTEFQTAAQLLASEKYRHRHDRPAPAGDEVPVSGLLQWFVSEERPHMMQAVIGSIEASDRSDTHTNSFEFVSGSYSPSTRRLVLAGTHIANGARGVITPDLYDLDISEDGHTATGRSQLPNGSWGSKMTLESSRLAQMHELDDDQKQAMQRAEEALEKIRDENARVQVKREQEQMYRKIFEEVPDGEVQAVHQDLMKIAEEQSTRLGKLISDCMAKYRILSVRFNFIENIHDIAGPPQREPPKNAGDDESDQVRALLGIAAWHEKDFRQPIRTLVCSLNKAVKKNALEEFCNEYGLDGCKYPFAFSSAMKIPCEHEDGQQHFVTGRFGAPKSFDRALVKMSQGKSLKDLNRATLVFEDPYLMRICFDALKSKFNVVAVKNKFKQQCGWLEPPDLHLNLELGDGWLVEVQLLFNDILLIKKELHHFYDILRSSSPLELISPLYKSGLGAEDFC